MCTLHRYQSPQQQSTMGLKDDLLCGNAYRLCLKLSKSRETTNILKIKIHEATVHVLMGANCALLFIRCQEWTVHVLK